MVSPLSYIGRKDNQDYPQAILLPVLPMVKAIFYHINDSLDMALNSKWLAIC